MAFTGINFLNAPLVKTDYSFLKDALDAYQQTYKNRLLTKYGAPEEQSKIDLTNNQAKNFALQNQFLPASTRAKIALMQAQANEASMNSAKAKAFADILKKYGMDDSSQSSQSINPQGQNTQQNIPSMPSSLSPEGNVSPIVSAFKNQIQANQGGQNIPNKMALNTQALQHAIIGSGVLKSVLPGLMENKIENIDGNRMLITPKGVVQIAQGQTPLQKELTPLEAKEIKDLEKNSQIVAERRHTLNQIHEILDRNHSATGLWPQLKSWARFGSKDYGTINALVGPLQADLATKYSSRGSVYGTKLAGNRKPSGEAGYDENIGRLEALQNSVDYLYPQMRARYRELTGHDLPYAPENKYKPISANNANPEAVKYLRSLTKEQREALKKQAGLR